MDRASFSDIVSCSRSFVKTSLAGWEPLTKQRKHYKRHKGFVCRPRRCGELSDFLPRRLRSSGILFQSASSYSGVIGLQQRFLCLSLLTITSQDVKPGQVLQEETRRSRFAKRKRHAKDQPKESHHSGLCIFEFCVLCKRQRHIEILLQKCIKLWDTSKI